MSLFEAIGHVARLHMGRLAQHLFGRGAQPFTDILPDPIEYMTMRFFDGLFDQIVVVDTLSFW